MEVPEIKSRIPSLSEDQIIAVRALIDEIHSDAQEEIQEVEELAQDSLDQHISTDNTEDMRSSLFFAITELEEVERGELSLEDKLFDLRMRHCRFL